MFFKLSRQYHLCRCKTTCAKRSMSKSRRHRMRSRNQPRVKERAVRQRVQMQKPRNRGLQQHVRESKMSKPLPAAVQMRTLLYWVIFLFENGGEWIIWPVASYQVLLGRICTALHSRNNAFTVLNPPYTSCTEAPTLKEIVPADGEKAACCSHTSKRVLLCSINVNVPEGSAIWSFCRSWGGSMLQPHIKTCTALFN